MKDRGGGKGPLRTYIGVLTSTLRYYYSLRGVRMCPKCNRDKILILPFGRQQTPYIAECADCDTYSLPARTSWGARRNWNRSKF